MEITPRDAQAWAWFEIRVNFYLWEKKEPV